MIITEIRKFRVRLDTLVKETKSLDKTREVSLVITKLQESKMWMGELLALLGENSPYSNDGKRKTIKDIEPEADVSNNEKQVNIFENQVQKVDFLREEIKAALSELEKIKHRSYFTSEVDMQKVYLVFNNAYSYLTEARLWLGMELGRMRDISNVFEKHGVKPPLG